MPFTLAQLTSIYMSAAGGLPPSAATSLILQAYAQQTQAGSLSDAVARQYVLDFAAAALPPTPPSPPTPSPPSPPPVPLSASDLADVFKAATHGGAPTPVQQQAIMDIVVQTMAGVFNNDEARAAVVALTKPVSLSDLASSFANVSLGVMPNGEMQLALQAVANRSAVGALTPAQALQAAVDLTDTTTAVSVETYQFFLGAAPSLAGLAALSKAFADGGGYAGLNGENRFIAQSVAIATQNAQAKSDFAAAYGALDYAAAAQKAYGVIVGAEAASQAGIDMAAAVAWFSRPDNISYLKAFIAANTALKSVTDLDLAVKAAIVGEILYAATTWSVGGGVGAYASASNALLRDLAAHGATAHDNPNGVDLFAFYGHPSAEAVKLAGAPVETH